MSCQEVVFPKTAVVAVISGAGFIGSNLCEGLRNKGCAGSDHRLLQGTSVTIKGGGKC